MFSSLRSTLFLAAVIAFPAMKVEAQAIPPARVAIVNAQKAVADTQELKKDQADLEAK